MGGLSTSQMIVAAAAPAIAAIITGAYRRWKYNRTEIEVSQNWRGEWITDRKIKLFERFLWVAFFLSYPLCFYLGFYYDWT